MLLQVVSLVEDLLKGLTPEVASAATLVFGDVEAALLASTKVQNQVVALDDAPDEPLVGPLLIVGPSAGQVLEHKSHCSHALVLRSCDIRRVASISF